MNHWDPEGVSWLEPPPPSNALPSRFPNPFEEQPSSLLRQLAGRLQDQLRRGIIAPGFGTELLLRPEGGKMFGLLLVRASEGRMGVLKAFSGQLGSAWQVPGWAPPVFDAQRRERCQSEAEAKVKALTERIGALERSPELLAERASLADAKEEWRLRRAQLRALYEERRRSLRADARPNAEERRERLEQREREARVDEDWKRAAALLGKYERRLTALRRLRRHLSRRAMRDVFDTYALTNARGETRLLRTLFAPSAPPWGAADCAAPKLLVHAFGLGLRPLALAEFWWGPPPRDGGRREAEFYPPCEAKCRPIVPFLLEGLQAT